MKLNRFKVNEYKVLLHILLIIAILISVFSCEKSRSGQEKGTTTGIEISPSQILITDLTGLVYKKGADDWIEVEIEELLTESDVVKTEMDAYCELQFGETALIRIQENSILRMNTVLSELGQSDIELGLSLGTVLCKVRKLAEDEIFEIETPGSVCAVRGTSFGVEVEESEDTSLFVEEGACAVIPLSIDPEKIEEKLSKDSEFADILIKEIEESVLIVKANQEVIISGSSLKANEELFKQVTNALEDLSKKEKANENEKKDLEKLIKRAAKDAMIQSMTLDNISGKHKEELTHIDNIKKKDIKIKTNKFELEEEKKDKDDKAGKDDKETGRESGEREEDKTEGKITQKITVHTKPNRAKVYVSGEFIGYTPVTIKEMSPGIYELKIEKEGYKPYLKEIELTAGNDQYHDLILEKEGPRVSRITIHTKPENVSVYFNGEYIGRTPCTLEDVEYGEYRVMLQRRGYTSLSRMVTVDEKNEKFIYPLKAESCEVATIKDVIDILGPPDNYSADEVEQLIEMRSHAEPIEFVYFNRFYFDIVNVHLSSILLLGDKKDFVFMDEIGIHSPRAVVEEKIGAPDAILSEGKLLKYSTIGVDIEINPDDVIQSFRLYKLDPLLSLEPLDADPEIAGFFEKLKKMPSHFGIE